MLRPAAGTHSKYIAAFAVAAKSIIRFILERTPPLFKMAIYQHMRIDWTASAGL